MNYYLELHETGSTITGASVTIDFGDCQPGRGAAIAGLRQAKNVVMVAYDIDEKNRRWEKEV